MASAKPGSQPDTELIQCQVGGAGGAILPLRFVGNFTIQLRSLKAQADGAPAATPPPAAKAGV